ncbi:MAG TPA: potassium-transporting ATPase subunit KdpA [Nitrososphaeraceae archaeon]
METTIQYGVIFVGALGLAVPFGLYIARMISFEMRPLERPLAKVERGFFRLIGVDVDKQMNWKEYLIALLLTTIISAIFVFLVLSFQNYLPSGQHVKGLSIDLAFHTAMSFVTNTNLQHYNGDQQLSSISQMVALTFMMFLAPAFGIVTGFAFIRSLIRKNFGLGNFYVDFVRVIITLLLPIAFISSLMLMVTGVPQTLTSSVTVNTVEGNNQTITMGPVASLEAIKEFGQNGGGFFGANSAHPFENPTGLSNMYEMILMLVVPLSFPIAYAKLIGMGRGISILAVMLIGFGSLLAFALYNHPETTLVETRFGTFSSTLFDWISISTNTGAINLSVAGMTPNAVISLLTAMFIQAVPGGAGMGMVYMLVYIILTIFVVGLMVGKTPEFMSMKISPKDVKKGVFIFLLHPATILIPTAIAFAVGSAQAIIGDEVTPAGYTQTLYEFTSAAANNGSDYFGASANTPFWNWSTGIVVFLGRYVPIALMIALAGSFTVKERKEVIEPIKTKGVTFVSVVVIVTFLLTALAFFPFLVIGPFAMWGG